MSLVRRLGLGRLAYWAWHSPRASWRRICAEGGVIERVRTLSGRHAMRVAAQRLPRLELSTDAPYPTPVCFLTGTDFWDQTAFCAHSLARNLGRRFHLLLIDDDSLSPWHVDAIASCGVSVDVIGIEEARSNLARTLPSRRFPRLNALWSSYKNLRKLIDPHLARPGWKLVLDSDMLFYRFPAEIDAWLEAPSVPLVMRDVVESYGYQRSLMERLAGHPVPEEVNVGVTGLDGDSLDWERLEHWIDTMMREQGSHYFLEQALVAMTIAGAPLEQLDGRRYRVLPDAGEVAAPTAVLHHFVAESRTALVRHAWRSQLGRSE